MRYLSRSQWGANAMLPRRGHLIGPLRRTEVFVHHTALTRPGGHPNVWESLGEVRAAMRDLQVLRRDTLGADVPYNAVGFCMADGELVLCEGRGLWRTGAHTHGHNRSALGIALQGDFQRAAAPPSFTRYLAQLGGWLRGLRQTDGFDRLGDRRPPGRHVFGHRDAAATACPGDRLYARLTALRFIPEDDDMAMDRATWKQAQRALQALDPPLYAGRRIDGKPGRNTDRAVQAFERRLDFQVRGVIGEANDPNALIWPATREMLFTLAFGRTG